MNERPAGPPADDVGDHHPERDRADAPAPGDVPNEEEAERRFGVTQDGRSTAERGTLDEDGEDRRLYTGEPVPTEHGFVVPAQSVTGREQDVGGGEWPDAPPRGTDPTADEEPDDEPNDQSA